MCEADMSYIEIRCVPDLMSTDEYAGHLPDLRDEMPAASREQLKAVFKERWEKKRLERKRSLDYVLPVPLYVCIEADMESGDTICTVRPLPSRSLSECLELFNREPSPYDLPDVAVRGDTLAATEIYNVDDNKIVACSSFRMLKPGRNADWRKRVRMCADYDDIESAGGYYTLPVGGIARCLLQNRRVPAVHNGSACTEEAPV